MNAASTGMGHDLTQSASAISLAEAQALVFLEAKLLDEGRFEDWLELYADDAVYWIPLERGQQDPLNVPSIIYENRDLLGLRVGRLAHPRTYLMSPKPCTTHLVGNVMLERSEGGPASEGDVSSVVFVHECREDQRRLFSGRCRHTLRRTPDGLRIVRKRVDLVDCAAIQSAFLIPL